MILELLTKSQLQIINRRSNLRYPLHAAEKDYFLAERKYRKKQSWQPLRGSDLLRYGTLRRSGIQELLRAAAPRR
jgi:hypothetical protein